jgi:hypothetical protein
MRKRRRLASCRTGILCALKSKTLSMHELLEVCEHDLVSQRNNRPTREGHKNLAQGASPGKRSYIDRVP